MLKFWSFIFRQLLEVFGICDVISGLCVRWKMEMALVFTWSFGPYCCFSELCSDLSEWHCQQAESPDCPSCHKTPETCCQSCI